MASDTDALQLSPASAFSAYSQLPITISARAGSDAVPAQQNLVPLSLHLFREVPAPDIRSPAAPDGGDLHEPLPTVRCGSRLMVPRPSYRCRAEVCQRARDLPRRSRKRERVAIGRPSHG